MRNPGMWERLENLKKPVRCGIAGGGEFSAGIVSQSAFMKNFEVSAIADLVPEHAVRVFEEAGYHPSDILVTDSRDTAARMIESGKRVVLSDALMLSSLPLDALLDVTGDPAFGAEYAWKGIENEKHVIVVNIESDAGVGAILRRRADEAGVVYTEADGDQPSLIMGLYDFCKCLGIDVEVAGKWTHHKPYDSHQSRGRVNEGFLDGSKNQIEMCCVANMTGFLPDVPGMHMPSVAFDDILNVFDRRENGGILSRMGVVETINCLTPDGKTEIESRYGGGVFVIGRGESKAFRNVALHKGFLHSADGSRVLLYRPYHMVGIETPVTVLRACLYNEATAAPMHSPVADVVSVAKKALAPGDLLDGIGGETVRGIMTSRTDAFRKNALPLVLAQKIRVTRPVREGEILTYDDIAPGNDFLWNLRRKQDAET